MTIRNGSKRVAVAMDFLFNVRARPSNSSRVCQASASQTIIVRAHGLWSSGASGAGSVSDESGFPVPPVPYPLSVHGPACAPHAQAKLSAANAALPLSCCC